jgi:hypothetical protein
MPAKSTVPVRPTLFFLKTSIFFHFSFELPTFLLINSYYFSSKFPIFSGSKLPTFCRLQIFYNFHFKASNFSALPNILLFRFPVSLLFPLPIFILVYLFHPNQMSRYVEPVITVVSVPDGEDGEPGHLQRQGEHSHHGCQRRGLRDGTLRLCVSFSSFLRHFVDIFFS